MKGSVGILFFHGGVDFERGCWLPSAVRIST